MTWIVPWAPDFVSEAVGDGQTPIVAPMAGIEHKAPSDTWTALWGVAPDGSPDFFGFFEFRGICPPILLKV